MGDLLHRMARLFTRRIKCPACEGNGYTFKYDRGDIGNYLPRPVMCGACDGHGDFDRPDGVKT